MSFIYIFYFLLHVKRDTSPPTPYYTLLGSSFFCLLFLAIFIIYIYTHHSPRHLYTICTVWILQHLNITNHGDQKNTLLFVPTHPMIIVDVKNIWLQEI